VHSFCLSQTPQIESRKPIAHEPQISPTRKSPRVRIGSSGFTAANIQNQLTSTAAIMASEGIIRVTMFKIPNPENVQKFLDLYKILTATAVKVPIFLTPPL